MAPVFPDIFNIGMLVNFASFLRPTPDAAVPLASLEDLSSFVYYQFGRNVSEQQKDCFRGGLCPWLNSTGYKGPCPKGEWYLYNRKEILDRGGLLEPVCQPPPCPPGYSLLLPDQKCYHDDDDRIHANCSVEQSPRMNLFGETFCHCSQQMATLLGSENKECYKLFTQGPCDKGSLFVPVNDLVNFGQGQCFPSPCAELLNGSNRMAEIRFLNGSTGCFELQVPGGPCRDYGRLEIADISAFPGVTHLKCNLTPGASLLITAVIERCVPGDDGKCATGVLRTKKPMLELRFSLEDS